MVASRCGRDCPQSKRILSLHPRVKFLTNQTLTNLQTEHNTDLLIPQETSIIRESMVHQISPRWHLGTQWSNYWGDYVLDTPAAAARSPAPNCSTPTPTPTPLSRTCSLRRHCFGGQGTLLCRGKLGSRRGVSGRGGWVPFEFAGAITQGMTQQCNNDGQVNGSIVE